VLETRGLTKAFANGFRLELDLAVADGETLALTGPSGCGKTTALSLIAGLSRPDGGEILLDGRPVTGLPAWKRNVQVVFQDLALFPHLNVWRNVTYGLFIRGVPAARRREAAEALLERVRLPGFAGRNVATLSGGERQRVAIARALAVQPRALLMDEPLSSLDAPLRRDLRAELREILAGSAFPCVFVTHDREEAAVLGGRVALMRDGRIVEEGPDVVRAPTTAFGREFFLG